MIANDAKLPTSSFFRRVLGWVWASPNTVLGLAIGILGLLTGGKARVCCGIIECYGGLIGPILALVPINPTAMTLGHVVLGKTSSGLQLVREHELVHVRQYEAWGPFFLPAYLGSSVYLWCVGKDAYRDNPFEVEAFESTGPKNDK